MPDRIEISHRSKPIPCGQCGQQTSHVGRIVSAAGALLGRDHGLHGLPPAAPRSYVPACRLTARDAPVSEPMLIRGRMVEPVDAESARASDVLSCTDLRAHA